ncbi:MAG TPA: polysaccharide deacetylase family protein [Alphaproteobacteria bacterium]|jgi:hypothetical protein|nr:polysaccharide deacetylase family protein [Alphaproteobacteria bacterium]
MSAWDALRAELDRWAEAGRAATLWWRDDDAGAPSSALNRLVALSEAHRVPLTLAVIPTKAGAEIAGLVAGAATLTAVQHGYAHLNHAPDGERKMELGPHRPADVVVAELAVGWDRLETLFGARLRPVLVPPWNRIAPHLVPMLPELGYLGLSTFGPRPRARPVAGLVQANSHLDIIDWAGHRGFVGTEAALAALVGHLRARRTGAVADPAEPTGLLTHHLAHDAGAWGFVEALLHRSKGHGGARWLDAEAAFQPAPDHPGR